MRVPARDLDRDIVELGEREEAIPVGRTLEGADGGAAAEVIDHNLRAWRQRAV